MRIVVDLDGTICTLRQPGQTYADVLPLPGAAETLRGWKREGHTIIIHTARHMRTCQGDIGRVLAKVGKLTLDWLEAWGIPYDEIVFGKPDGDLYIDDKALRFQSWEAAAFRIKLEGGGS